MVNSKSKSIKRLSYTDFLIGIAILLAINILGNIYYTRLDLTKEKRYTLAHTSKQLAAKLSEKMYFKLYLAGDLSSNFQQLQQEIRDKIYEFREASGKSIEIEIIDPLKGKDKKEVAEILKDFSLKGLKPVRDVENEEADQTRIKFVVPSAEIEYAGNTYIANFFDYDGQMDISNAINNSIKNIEYEMANAMRQAVSGTKKRIVVVDGNQEMIGQEVGYFATELSKYYNVEAVNLNIADPEVGRPFLNRIQRNPDSAQFILMQSLQNRLKGAELLMMVKPAKDYSPTQLYLIDQFLMNGGKLLWLVESANIEIDSFQTRDIYPALNRNLENINASLFTYGVSLNADLLQDQECNKIPQYNGQRLELNKFMYFPLFTRHNTHLITKNLGAVWGQFSSTLKPKARPGLSYTPLLMSSANSQTVQVPASVEFITSFMQNRRPEFLNNMRMGPQITALLLEGQFKSPFVNQTHYNPASYKASGTSKMIVISDADLIRNQVSQGTITLPTGYDRYTGITFANQQFLMNCIDYLIDQNGLIEIRSKDYNLRLLDQAKVRTEKPFWQWLNVGLPIAVIALFGLINHLIRRRKYAQ